MLLVFPISFIYLWTCPTSQDPERENKNSEQKKNVKMNDLSYNMYSIFQKRFSSILPHWYFSDRQIYEWNLTDDKDVE